MQTLSFIKWIISHIVYVDFFRWLFIAFVLFIIFTGVKKWVFH